MTRRNERIVVGVLGLISAAISLYVGLQFFASSQGEADVAIVAADPSESASDSGAGSDPSAPGSDADGDADTDDADGAALIVTTTLGESSTTSSVTSSTAATSTTVQPTSQSTTTTVESSSTSSSSTTTSEPPTTVSSTTTSSSVASSSSSSTSTTAVEPSTTTTAVVAEPPATLSETEREIFRLTNELRTNPAGPLRRVGPTPECVHEKDDIEFDPETGHPKPVPALSMSEPVSLRMARDWSQQMADADQMSHRSGESQNQIYDMLGIDWMARGENVAWAVGYSPNAIAELFFSGWRESAGHYCNMMSASFTHIGVGHVRTEAGKDFATQNFYRPR